MTTEEVIERIVKALEEEFGDEARVGRIEGEDCIGLDVSDDTWFIEVQG